MSFKEDVEVREQIMKMNFKQAEILKLFYMNKPFLKDYEIEILEFAKERLEQLEKQNHRKTKSNLDWEVKR